VFTCFAQEAVYLLAPAEEALTKMEHHLLRDLLQNIGKYDKILKNITKKHFVGKNEIKKKWKWQWNEMGINEKRNYTDKLMYANWRL